MVGTFKVFIAEALGETGDVTAGLEEIDQAFAAMEEIGEAITKAEAHRIKGKLLLMRSEANAGEAESCFRKAIEIAQSQQAKGWELRAAMSLAHLWQSQGKKEKARLDV